MKTKTLLSILFLLPLILLAGCSQGAEKLINAAAPSINVDTASAETNLVQAEDEVMLDFPIQLLNGETTTLRDHRGETVLLVFFSVNCGHCHKESSHLDAIYQEFTDQDFIILSAEVSGANDDALQEFIDSYNITFPLGTDKNAQFAYYLEVTGVPTNFLIDPSGNVIDKIVGFRDEATLRDLIAENLSDQ